MSVLDIDKNVEKFDVAVLKTTIDEQQDRITDLYNEIYVLKNVLDNIIRNAIKIHDEKFDNIDLLHQSYSDRLKDIDERLNSLIDHRVKNMSGRSSINNEQ